MSHGGQALHVEEARRRIRAGLEPVAGVEVVYPREAHGRVLAAPVYSPLDVPGHDNSAMDGYALRGADLQSDGETVLLCVGRTLAGEVFNGPVAPGQCVRIMTGAPIPDGADTVVMQENARTDGDQVVVAAGQRPGDNVRPAGEDIRKGEVVLEAGTRLRTPEIGVLGSLGCVEVPVRRRLRVAYFSTGDELRGAGEVLEPGQIYDSNRYTLNAALRRLGAEVTDLGVVEDAPEALADAFRAAGSFADVLITSGGVSVGEADHVKAVLEAEGEVAFWRVALRPGRPLAYGRVGRAVFFGLPGNPVSVAATFHQLVRPTLRHLSGEPESALQPQRFPVPCQSDLDKKAGRTEFQRGILEWDASGMPHVRSTGSQGSGQLTSMTRANCFIVLEHDRGPVAAGETVLVEPFEGVL